ncbi:hypothetical protein RJ640_015118 [Escallonia rubra]|uniref:Uncharacterized protein n=1 Tax=Escallonia rubra TaxID=112253 RepID=A0AA88UD86_9ASTE|nr:hypothetical protein RJ640_015118 [Escallonia rubra]
MTIRSTNANGDSWSTNLFNEVSEIPVLWAFRTSPKSSTVITLYALTYGHDPVLPMKITVKSFQMAVQNQLPGGYGGGHQNVITSITLMTSQ